MFNIINTYFIYVKIFFKARSEYKVGFIAGVFANFYCYFLTFLSFWIIVHRFENIAGWNFEDMSILYGLNLFTYAVAGMLVWYSIYHLEREVTTGRLDLYLTRPMSVIGQLICSRFGDTFIGQIIVTLMYLINALLKNGEQVTWPTLIYFLSILVSGVCLQVGAMIIIGSLSFWTLRSEKIGMIFYYKLRTLTHYPLIIYPGWIKALLTLIPWAFINYYPAMIILGKSTTYIEYIFGLLAPGVGIVILIFSIWFFNEGLKRYTSAGN